MKRDPKSAKSTPAKKAAPASKVDSAADISPINQVIASLTGQLRRDNRTIIELMERQRSLRQQLLKAQEQSLVALRRSRQSKQADSSGQNQ